MTGRAVANEFAKMRRLHVAPIVAVLVLGVTALSCLTTFTYPGFTDMADDPARRPWSLLLASLGLAVPLLSPVLLAVVASRQVDIEHKGGGWLLARTSGLPPGRLCRAKLAAIGSLVAAATLLQSLLVAALGALAGITAPFPTAFWLGSTALVTVVNLALLAFHLLLAARVANQLVGIGAGVMGVFVVLAATGMPAWLARLVPPWGYYALANPAEVGNDGAAPGEPATLSVLLLGAAACAVFVAATARLDRQEA